MKLVARRWERGIYKAALEVCEDGTLTLRFFKRGSPVGACVGRSLTLDAFLELESLASEWVGNVV